MLKPGDVGHWMTLGRWGKTCAEHEHPAESVPPYQTSFLKMGLNWLISCSRKQKYQIAKAPRKQRESQLEGLRCESFAKVISSIFSISLRESHSCIRESFRESAFSRQSRETGFSTLLNWIRFLSIGTIGQVNRSHIKIKMGGSVINRTGLSQKTSTSSCSPSMWRESMAFQQLVLKLFSCHPDIQQKSNTVGHWWDVRANRRSVTYGCIPQSSLVAVNFELKIRSRFFMQPHELLRSRQGSFSCTGRRRLIVTRCPNRWAETQEDDFPKPWVFIDCHGRDNYVGMRSSSIVAEIGNRPGQWGAVSVVHGTSWYCIIIWGRFGEDLGCFCITSFCFNVDAEYTFRVDVRPKTAWHNCKELYNVIQRLIVLVCIIQARQFRQFSTCLLQLSLQAVQTLPRTLSLIIFFALMLLSHEAQCTGCFRDGHAIWCYSRSIYLEWLDLYGIDL